MPSTSCPASESAAAVAPEPQPSSITRPRSTPRSCEEANYEGSRLGGEVEEAGVMDVCDIGAVVGH